MINTFYDMLTRIRNSQKAKHSLVYVVNTKLNRAILTILLSERFISSFNVQIRFIKVNLLYKGLWKPVPLIKKIYQIGSVKNPIFVKYSYLNNFLTKNLMLSGFTVISTSLGIMGSSTAIKLRVGGKLLCYISS